MPILDRFLQAVHGFRLFKALILGGFLVGSTPLCLRNGLYFAALVNSAMGAFWAVYLLAPGESFIGDPWRRGLRTLMLAEFLLIGGVAGWRLARPVEAPWQVVPGTKSMTDATLAVTSPGRLLVLVSGGRGALFEYDPAQSQRPETEHADHAWQWLDYPGGQTWELIHDAGRGLLFAAPDAGIDLYALPLPAGAALGGGGWRQSARPPGLLRSVASAGDALGIVVDRRLFLWPPGRPLSDVPVEVPQAGGVECVALGRGEILAAGARILTSADGGGHFDDVTPAGADLDHPQCVLTQDGHAYVFAGGLWTNEFYARAPGGRFIRRDGPRDIRVLVANPEDGAEIYAGSWGGGVFGSRHAGERWVHLGLDGIEVRALAVDFAGRRVYAGASNLVRAKGIYLRPLP